MEENPNLELRKFVAPEFLFGSGAIDMVDRYIHNFRSKKVMIVTDPGIIEAGWAGRIEKLLKDASIPYVLFHDTTPNPKDFEVINGAEIYMEEGCDIIVAIGGGSPMDCAKGIGIVCTNGRHILEFEGVDEVPVPGPPLICIPTTAGTAADISQFAIICDTERQVKIAIVSKTVVPDVALIDPLTTTTMTPELTAETGMDALVHAFEAYVSNASSPVTDLNALEAVRLISGSLYGAWKEPLNIEYRRSMMLGSLFAGLAFSNASLGLVHAMAHSLGGLRDLPHGECNALLLEEVINYNFSSAAGRYTRLAGALGVSGSGEIVKENLIKTLSEFRKSIGIDYRLSDLGITRKIIPDLARFALADPCVITNPRVPDVKDIEGVYEKAL